MIKMADDREPPPLFDEENSDNLLKDDDEDLFASVNENAPKLEQMNLKDDEEEEERDIFADANQEVPLDSPMEQKPAESLHEPLSTPSAPQIPVTDVSEETPPPSLPSVATNGPPEPVVTPFAAATEKTREEIEEEESEDTFNMEITITDPIKRGDGMGAYMAYRVNTSTTSRDFSRPEMSVYRRFSDFLGLHEKLVEKHQHQGKVVPPAPEKSVVGMTKIKMTKEEQNNEFIQKRRAQLERFLNRIAKHPELRADPDFVEFLEKDEELPKSTSTSALSGAGVMRLFNKMGDSIGKIAFHMNETDELYFMRAYFCQLLPYDDEIQWSEEFQWFEEKQQQIESLDHQLRKLHSSIEALVQYRRELAHNTGNFSRSLAMVGNTEENTSLSRALSQLAEIEEKIDQLHQDQADSDFYVLSELMKDYIMLIGSVKDVLNERVKIFKAWKDAETTLNKKREEKAKLELQRKLDKVPAIAQECTRLEGKVGRFQEEFEAISKSIKKEITRFERQRVKDFKSTIVNYLENILNSQQQLIKYWESFLPEAKAIA